MMADSVSTEKTMKLDLTRTERSVSARRELRSVIRKLRDCYLRSAYHPERAWRGQSSGRPVLQPMVDADGVWCIACIAKERKMLVREVRGLAESDGNAEILFAESSPRHVLERRIIESTEVDERLIVTLDMSVLSSDSVVEVVEKVRGAGNVGMEFHGGYAMGGNWLPEFMQQNLSLDAPGRYSPPEHDELEIEAWRWRIGRWRSEYEHSRHWGVWGKEWGPSRRLSTSEVAKFRAAMPFGPLSLDECESFAIRFQSHPRTILKIAQARLYAQTAACPPDHPLWRALYEDGVPKRKSHSSSHADSLRQEAQRYRDEIGEAQDWKCRCCGVDVSDRSKSAIDHIMPISSGGTSERSNLQLLCRRCNGSKAAFEPSAELEERMARRVKGEGMMSEFTREMNGASSCGEMEVILSRYEADVRAFVGSFYYASVFETLRSRARMMPDYPGSIWYYDAPVVHCVLLMKDVELCVARGPERRGRRKTSVIEDVSCYLCQAEVDELREGMDIHYVEWFRADELCTDGWQSSGLATRDLRIVSCESCRTVLESSVSGGSEVLKRGR